MFWRPVLVVVLVVLSLASPALATVAPGELMLFYGWPGRGMGPCNGCFPEGSNADLRAAEFGIYDDVVFGAGLELVSHPEHDLVDQILSHPGMGGTRVWGYVDAGVTTSNFTVSEILARADAWKAMGAYGIFLDDFGYDFGTSRTRQNAIVTGIHALGIPVLANSFRPQDAFSSAVDPTWNPTGAPTALNSGDVYFFESHGVRLDVRVSATDWMAKSDALRGYQNAIGFGIYSTTSKATDSPYVYDEEGFFAAWMLAAIAGHASTGYSEYQYSASGASNGAHVYRTRPSVGVGSNYFAAFGRDGDIITRPTNAGLLYVNLASGAATVLSASAAPQVDRTPLRMEAPSPNPFNPRTTIAFETETNAPVVVEIFDVKGRAVRSLYRGEGGTVRLVWDGCDDRGQELSSGVYFVRARQKAVAVTQKAVLVR